VFLGSGRFGLPSFARLVEAPAIDVVGVVTAPARPAGRRHELKPTPIELSARELGIEPVLAPERLRAPESIATILALEPALAVLVDYGQIVPSAILDLPLGALNLHPSLLPRHRGASPIPATILAGDDETGVTLIRMDQGLDTGPILAARTVALAGTETAADLGARLEGVAAELLADSLGPWLAGALPVVPQDEGAATMTRPLRREDGRLLASRSATQLERQVRAYAVWPGSFVETPVGRLIVHEAAVEDEAPEPVGLIDLVGLNTIQGRLAFRRVQPAGGTAMAWDDYLRGGAKLVGSSIVE
jgi:methionyl-tRNA formyltransferase